MPIYEYRCSDCQKKVSVFFRSFSTVNHADTRCPKCNGQHLTRLVSKVRVIRGSMAPAGDGGGNDLDESMLDDVNENDPRSLGRMMRRMADETGEDLGPEFGEVINRLEKGEDPEAIEKSMPELGELAGGGMGMPDDL
jgi:putative FmdB family regulatory protein